MSTSLDSWWRNMARNRLNMDDQNFYYATVATGDDFIKNYTQYALKSLLKTGIPASQIHCSVNDKHDRRVLGSLVPEIENVKVIKENYDHVVWKYMKGKRRYSYFKAAAMYKTFPEPIHGKYLVCFDGDVLWYKNPTEFLMTKKSKTWFHHGKDLQKRCSVLKSKIDPTNYESLSRWVDPAFAHLLIKHNITNLPEREVVAGFYLLHPKDHDVLRLTYEYVKEIAKMFQKDDSAGEQKPFNAALCTLGVDWHGGSKFFCPEHSEYFDHFFGKKDLKKVFHKKVRKMGL